MEERGKYDFDFSGRKILVVEDNMISFKLISAVLVRVNAGVTHALNGRDAIELCRTGCGFDLVLMDIMLPEVDGLEATRAIKKICPDLPVIATTANTFIQEEKEYWDAGCDAFLTKPLQFKQLFELMEDFFHGQE